MATVGLTTTSQSDVVKAPKKPKVTSEEKKAPAHPTYAEMVVASISALADRKGSSRIAIANYVLQNYNVGGDSKKVNLHVGVNLKKGADSGLLQRKSGIGANGRFRLGEAAKVAAKKAARKTTTKSPKEATTSKSPKKAATTKSLKVVGKKTAVEEKKAATSKKSTVKTAKGDSATLKAKSPKKATAKSAKMANSDSSIPKAPKKATVKSVKTTKGDSATRKVKSPKKATVKSAKMAKSDSATPKAKSPKKATIKLAKTMKASTKV